MGSESQYCTTDGLRELYHELRPRIEARLGEFKRFWREGTDKELFIELVFCLLTPQSGAGRCWKALCGLRDSGLLYRGGFTDLRDSIRSVRFMNNKAKNILMAREMFMEGGTSLRQVLSSAGDDSLKRDWLVRSVRGLGMKEASHYLRNIGLGRELAILDRHILRRLAGFGAIAAVPASLSPARYRDLEKSYMRFAEMLSIDPLHLDLLLWYAATGEIFK